MAMKRPIWQQLEMKKIDTEVILITAANELENVKQRAHLGVLELFS